MSTARDEFIARLIAERKRRRLSQKTLATLMGVAQQSLSGWERGESKPTRRSLRTWALTLRMAPPPERPAVRAKCGTLAGYEHHKSHRETQCDPCTDANASYMQEYRAKRRAAVTR